MRRVLVCSLLCACTPSGESAPAEALVTEKAARKAPEPATAPQVEEVQQEETAVEPDPERPAPEPEPCTGVPVPALPAHPDLVLDLKSKGRSSIEFGQPVDLEPAIRNASKTEHHFAVLSGDGSEPGWREPHVWYSGFIDTGDGCWRPLEVVRPARCGMFDANWQDDVIDMAPGDTSTLEWISSPAYSMDMHEPGRVRFYLHYAYRAGHSAKGEVDEPPEVGDMAGVDAFELVSNPVEFEVQQPLKLHASAKDHHGSVSRVSQLLDVELENTSRKGRKLATPNGNSLHFEIEGTKLMVRPKWNPGDENLPKHRLGPGRSVPMLGPSSPNAALEVPWINFDEKVFRIRAAYQPYGEVEAPPVVSDWVDIDLR